MPLYEFECDKCGRFEKRTEVGASSLNCPNCGSPSRRVFSLFSWKTFNILRKDGEGFSSVAYRPEEYKQRVRNNLGKYDKL